MGLRHSNREATHGSSLIVGENQCRENPKGASHIMASVRGRSLRWCDAEAGLIVNDTMYWRRRSDHRSTASRHQEMP
ncbi:unnamed protein product [Linum trigynum]|uniref:Uncharacterized protein n=1 Tax=Linum trigynum TaxID=586398 RepID=A0AAV2FS18_9ROSI